MAGELKGAVAASINQWNQTTGASWTLGTSWDSVGTDFETFVHKNFFPVLTETIINLPTIGNPFQWLAKQRVLNGGYRQEFAVVDQVPTGVNLNTDGKLIIDPLYPKVKTRLYQNGFRRKMKFTIDLSGDILQNFLTLEDGIEYVIAQYISSLNSINIAEYREMFGAIVDYTHSNLTKYQKRTVDSLDEAIDKTYELMKAMQRPSSAFNEGILAAGPAVSRLTRKTPLDRIMILCSDRAATRILNTNIANTFQIAGLDISDHILNFPTIEDTPPMDGVFKVTEDVIINDPDTLAYLKAMGMYNTLTGTVFKEGAVFTFDITTLKDFKGKYEQIGLKDDSDIILIDTASIMYYQDTSNMVRTFENPEIDAITYYLKYTSTKNISPFTNKAVITSGE